MFDSLSGRLERLGTSLRSRARLTDADLEEALAEVRAALLEADVELSVVRAFLDAVRERVRGENVAQSLTPGQHVIKAVHDQLIEVLGGTALKVTYASKPPDRGAARGSAGRGQDHDGRQARLVVQATGPPALPRGYRLAAPRRRRTVAGAGQPDRRRGLLREHRSGVGGARRSSPRRYAWAATSSSSTPRDDWPLTRR